MLRRLLNIHERQDLVLRMEIQGLALVPKELLETSDIRIHALQITDNFLQIGTPPPHVAVLIQPEQIGIVTQHFDGVRTVFRNIRSSELKMFIYCIDIQKNKSNRNQTKPIVNKQPSDYKSDIDQQQVGKA